MQTTPGAHRAGGEGRRFRYPATAIAALSMAAIASGIARTADRQGVLAEDVFPPRSHAAWVYDVKRESGKPNRVDPGYFAGALNDYNRRAGEAHRIGMVYTYGGSLEMYCPEGDAASCRPSDLVVVYGSGEDDKDKGGHGERAGAPTTRAYRQKMDAAMAGGDPAVVAIVDGVVNADYEGSMKGFNELPRELAQIFADKVTRQVCSDPMIDGVQFDIEPFDVRSRNGQYWFYRRIAENFAGGVPAGDGGPAVDCKTADHPRGRFFSVFAAARHLRLGTPSAIHVQQIMTGHDNGYFIAPLYDLGAEPLGHATPLEQYHRQVRSQVSQLKRWAGELGIKYKFGIPAAASVHEYVQCRGESCANMKAAPASQLAYVKAALSAIEQSGARRDPLYLGNAVWTWSRGIVHGGAQFKPDNPPEDVLSYMAGNL